MATKQSKTKKNVFKVIGNFKKGDRHLPFTKEVYVENKQKAQDYVYSVMGSKHKLKRREITIEKIEELALDKVTDPVILQFIGGK